jgi:hypothetical protein
MARYQLIFNGDAEEALALLRAAKRLKLEPGVIWDWETPGPSVIEGGWGPICGATAMQTRFAEGLLAGLSQTEAAHRAGYSGARDSSQLRSSASATAQSKPVLALLALAESRGFGIPNSPGDRDELIRILWSHARSKDKSNSIRASVELDRIAREDMAANDAPGDPTETLKEIAETFPLMAASLAKKSGMHFEFTAVQQAELDRQAAEAARIWILAHCGEARRILDEPEMNGAHVRATEGTDAHA